MSLPLDDAFDAAAALEESGAFGEALQAPTTRSSASSRTRRTTSRARQPPGRSPTRRRSSTTWGTTRTSSLFASGSSSASATRPSTSMRVRVARALVNIGVDLRGSRATTTRSSRSTTSSSRSYGDATSASWQNQVRERSPSRRRATQRRTARRGARLYDAVLDRDEAVGEAGRDAARSGELLIKGNWRARSVASRDAGGLPEAIERLAGPRSTWTTRGAVLDLALRARVNEAIFLGRLGENRRGARDLRGGPRPDRSISTTTSIGRGSCSAPRSTTPARSATWTRRPDEALDLPAATTDRVAASAAPSAEAGSPRLAVVRAKMLTTLGRQAGGGRRLRRRRRRCSIRPRTSSSGRWSPTRWAPRERARHPARPRRSRRRGRDVSRDLRPLLGRSGAAAFPIGGLVGRSGGRELAQRCRRPGRVCRQLARADRRALRGTSDPDDPRGAGTHGRGRLRPRGVRSLIAAVERRRPSCAIAGATASSGSSRSVGPPPSTTTVSSGRPAPSPMYAMPRAVARVRRQPREVGRRGHRGLALPVGPGDDQRASAGRGDPRPREVRPVRRPGRRHVCDRVPRDPRRGPARRPARCRSRPAVPLTVRTNAIVAPFGDHAGSPAPPLSSVRRRRPVPSALITNRPGPPGPPDANTMLLPSGDQAGFESE